MNFTREVHELYQQIVRKNKYLAYLIYKDTQE